MVKIVNELGEVKTGVQGEAVYQGKYGQQIRRTRQPKRAIPSQKQLEHRQLYREALAWRKALSLPNRRYLDGYCIANWIVDDYKIALPWSRFALKLYLQHIGFVIVEKPIMKYLPAEEDFIEEQTQYDTDWPLYSAIRTAIGQRLTISDRKVVKLGFWAKKAGAPPGNVIFRIHRVSDNALLAEKVWGLAVDLPVTTTYLEATLDTPITINEEVRIAAWYESGDADNNVRVSFEWGDVKAGEYWTQWTGAAWGDNTGREGAYRYTYRVGLPGPPQPDYENSTLGLLHIRHPALLTGEHRRDGKLLESWTNLSNLDEEYITKQVGVDVFSRDELKFTTIAGVEYAFSVP